MIVSVHIPFRRVILKQTLVQINVEADTLMNEQLNILYEALNNTEDFLEQMELQGQIEDLEIRAGKRLPPKPIDSPYLCEGCSA